MVKFQTVEEDEKPEIKIYGHNEKGDFVSEVVPLPGTTKHKYTDYRTQYVPKPKKPKTTKDTIASVASMKLNALKTLYAAEVGSTTNKTKRQMRAGLRRKWGEKR